MADLFAGPHAPLSKAFLFCGWRRLPVDIKLDVSHDLSNPLRQDSLRKQLNQVDFIAAAFDCSTKSRAREIPRHFEDGRPAPKPFGLGPCQRDWRGPVRGIRSEWTRTTRHVLLPSRPFEQQPSVGQARCGALAFAPGGPILPVGAVPTMTHAAGAGHGVKGSACATTLTAFDLPAALATALHLACALHLAFALALACVLALACALALAVFGAFPVAWFLPLFFLSWSFLKFSSSKASKSPLLWCCCSACSGPDATPGAAAVAAAGCCKFCKPG